MFQYMSNFENKYYSNLYVNTQKNIVNIWKRLLFTNYIVFEQTVKLFLNGVLYKFAFVFAQSFHPYFLRRSCKYQMIQGTNDSSFWVCRNMIRGMDKACTEIKEYFHLSCVVEQWTEYTLVWSNMHICWSN